MRNGWRASGWALLFLFAARCGGSPLCLNCDAVPTPTPGPRDVITITGSIDSWTTFDDVTDIVVIACFDLDPSRTSPEDFNDCPTKSSTTPDEDRNFSLTNNLSVIDQDEANIRIAFWISRQEPKGGTIQPGDDFAELTEIASAVQNLEDVRTGQTAQISPVDVDFTTMIASTSQVRVFTPPDPTPTPNPQSTP